MLVRAPRVERIATTVAVIATVWFAFVAAWGIFQILGGGHSGAGSAGHAGFSWPIVKWKILYPSSDWYGTAPPDKSTYYCHHPLGTFWYSAIFLSVLGHHDYVVRLPTVLLSIGILPLLYGIGKQHWGTAVGAVSACAYAVVPIAIAFANFDNLETMGIFGSLLFFWGHSRHQATHRPRHLLASVLGAAACCSADWCGYATVAPLLGWGLVRAFVLPKRWTPPYDEQTYARWWALSVTVVVGSLALWIALFYKADRIGDWLASGDVRGGDGTPLKVVLEARKNWIDFSFTPLAIAVGKGAVPILLVRLLVLRRDEELYALSALFGAVVEYVVFKRGADVHIFWPHQFAEYYALAMAQLAATTCAVARLVARAFTTPARSNAVGAWSALVLGLAPSVAMTPDAMRALLVWRRTGGRYDDKGAPIRSDVDLLFVVENVIVPHEPPHATIDVSSSTGWGWEHLWGFGGTARAAPDPETLQPVPSTHPFWVGRASSMSSADQVRVATKAHVQSYGDIWVVDQRTGPGPLDAWPLVEREPNPFEWLVLGGWEPVRAIGRTPDPLRTWEWRVHLGQPSTTPPYAGSDPAESLDDLRIRQNAATYAGAIDRAALLRNQIEAALDRSIATDFERGLRLMGVRVTSGVDPVMEVWWAASGPMPADEAFYVRSSIEARARLSVMPADTTDREMNPVLSIPTKLWHDGFIYRIVVVLNHRIGRERYWGAWAGGGAPRRLDGRPETTLATIR
jgi:hypothetical protein